MEERVIERTPGACAFITETIVKAYPRPVGLDLQIVVPASEELGGITRLSREFHFTLRKVIRWVHDLTEREIEKEFFMQQLAAQCRTDFAADPRRVIQGTIVVSSLTSLDFLERGFISSRSDGQVLYHLPSVLPSPGEQLLF